MERGAFMAKIPHGRIPLYVVRGGLLDKRLFIHSYTFLSPLLNGSYLPTDRMPLTHYDEPKCCLEPFHSYANPPSKRGRF